MIKIEAVTLEEAYQNAADSLECSVTELKIEIAQVPSKGFLGLFKKSAIIVAMKSVDAKDSDEEKEILKPNTNEGLKKTTTQEKVTESVNVDSEKSKEKNISAKKTKKLKEQNTQSNTEVKKQSRVKKDEQKILNDTIMPASFVSTQDDEDEYGDVSDYLADYDDDVNDYCEEDVDGKGICNIVDDVQKEINELFDLTCFQIEKIEVSAYDEDTLLIEFKGDDAALLIGKEGYRYKALSYMIFNWINTKYQVQLRLEIAKFLKNQEESVAKYLVGVCENIERDGRAQTKILDGVLIQIALNELRNKYPDKYIVIRSTRDGLKYIIINDYHSN